ncbi:ABC-F family ATP-binding cassette domain-containing protein [Chromobacterium amazonense]|uniref:ATP-binding cassette domain-containing protein n=1 Tax=Chromobacterium amazonense TaxID=1382803 RepID=A0ABU8V5P8_9NEIS|nr:ATP-binding cassette domain-containing protein [Chromobacterium amazonense]MDQ4540182.1 ATP-binding cassette domain-containing protein [Chromobacterium amazonense]
MPIMQLQGLSLAFPHKTCFSDFHAQIDWGQRIGIVGANGSGKSSLLKMLLGELPSEPGRIRRDQAARIGYLPQIVERFDELSGGQRVNQALSQALAGHPDLLLLDEPSNHLDSRNRRALSRMLRGFGGAIALVTHDLALLDEVCDSIWHIGDGQIEIFSGRYADFLREREQRRAALERERAGLKREQEAAHQARMREQERAGKARERGARSIAERKWATIKSPTKLGRGNTTAGRKQTELAEQRRELNDRLSSLRLPERIAPRIQLTEGERATGLVLQISDGSVGYQQPVLDHIHLRLARGERLALAGGNGSGKSTLARAIAGIEPARRLGGDWLTPAPIGYLDQHYATLRPGLSVLETLRRCAAGWPPQRLRHFLSDFLFRDDAAVEADVATLSGGEKARLSLALIAARPPALLILDEMTNNLDLITRNHVIDILQHYPGAMLLISHDADFLAAVGQVDLYRLPRRDERK